MGTERAAHVFIFPIPFQGPVNCMLKLAEILSLAHIKVTFLNTEYIQKRLNKHRNAETYFSKYPGFRFETVPDGLPEDNPRTGDHSGHLLESVEAVAVPIFRQMLTSGAYGPHSGTPVTCLIVDGAFTCATGVAAQIGVPLFLCGIWSYICLPNLIEAGEVPFKDDNLDEIVTHLPGMEGIMRRRDLPSFCRSKTLDDRTLQLVLNEDKHIPLAQGLIFNTFEQLEAPILSQLLNNICPNIYTVGPLYAHLKARLAAEEGQETQPPPISNSIWEVDQSCISWLNQQPSKSVIYVSIGSLAVMSKHHMYEIWHGLVNSGTRFLWVWRPAAVQGLGSEIPAELTNERGYVVSWAPQEEVLAHPAVGGFLTHNGWNSTLESIAAGKPMICWPYFVEQQVNSRYVEQVWKLGLDMKDNCDRVVVEKMVKQVMDWRKDEFLERAEEMANLSKSAVSPGGSSFTNMDRLIQDIKMMKLTTK